jgi:hypothetical protein
MLEAVAILSSARSMGWLYLGPEQGEPGANFCYLGGAALAQTWANTGNDAENSVKGRPFLPPSHSYCCWISPTGPSCDNGA